MTIDSRIAVWRQKAIDGSLTIDDMKEAIAYFMQDRAATPPPASRTSTRKAAAPLPSAEDLLSGLDDLK